MDNYYLNIVIPNGFDKKEFYNMKQDIIDKFDLLFDNNKLNGFLDKDKDNKYKLHRQEGNRIDIDMYNIYKGDSFVVVYINKIGQMFIGWIENMKEYDGISNGISNEIWINYDEFMKMDNIGYFVNGSKLGLL